MCQAVLSSNLTKKFQWEVSEIANNRFPGVMLLGGLSANLNHLKTGDSSHSHSRLMFDHYKKKNSRKFFTEKGERKMPSPPPKIRPVFYTDSSSSAEE